MTENSIASTDAIRSARRFARVVPLAFITYGLAYFDRVNYSAALAGNLTETVKMSGTLSSLVAALFFIGYLAFQIPGAGYAERHSAKKLIFWAVVLWGILSSLQGLVPKAWMLAVVRTLLGVVESVVFPAMLVFLTHWFTKREKSRANTLLILGNPLTMASVSIVSGVLVGYFNTHRYFGRAGWQMMFIIEGLPSLIWALFWWFLADDRPAEARWLSRDEARAIQGKLDEEQRGIAPVKDYWAAFRDTRVLLLCVMYLCWSIGTYGFVFWLPYTLKNAAHLTDTRAGLIAAIPYLSAAFTMMVVSYWSDRLLQRKLFIWPAMILGGAAFALASLAGTSHVWWLFAALMVAGAAVYTPCGPLWALIAELVPQNVVGESMALVNSAGSVGGFLGTYLVGYLGGGKGFLFLGASLVTAGLIALLVNPRPQNRIPFATPLISSAET